MAGSTLIDRCAGGRWTLVCALAAWGFAWTGATRAAEVAPRPNIVVILADDLGAADLACCGSHDVRTPHTDRLFARGMRFERFYANCPVCSPTRAALLSGCYPDRVGVPGVIRTHADNNWGYLAADAVLLPELLAAAGYETACVGKWHLGLASPNTPTERGFSFFHGFLGDMMDDYYTHLRHGNNYMRRGRQTIEPEGHATDLFSNWACAYITRRRAGRPFFLYLAYNAPHTPIQPPDDWLAKVESRDPGITPRRAALIALIEHMDDGVGRVLAALEQAGAEDNTIVVFTSDNGGQLSAGANNGPLRDGKQSMYEGGLRVPAAIAWPGHVTPGTTSDRPLLTMDLYPTLAMIAGAEVKHEIDGVSFVDVLSGDAGPEPARDLYFVRREGGLPYGGKTIEALRRGDWKLVVNSPYAPAELYNLRDDPGEATDLAGKQPKIFAELSAALRRHIQRGGQVPWQRPETVPR